MYITDHAKARALERFGMKEGHLLRLLSKPTNRTFNIVDHKKSYDSSLDVGPKRVIETSANGRPAYLVTDLHSRVLTVLTETMAMRNFKSGKWTLP